MQVQIKGIVRQIKEWDKDRDGRPLPPERCTAQVLLMDRETGGDVQLTYPSGHGLTVGQDVDVVCQVNPQVRNFKLALYVVQAPLRKSK